MQFVLTLDWVSITASIVALLSLGASIFSAIGAARSADVALDAEHRVVANERASAVRELLRTAAMVNLEVNLVTQELENASRSAIANAECYGTPDGKRPFLHANSEFQQKIGQMTEMANHGITVEAVTKQSDTWLETKQLELDRTLVELSGVRAWATRRAEQLTYVNRQIAEDITAAERAQGIYVRLDHNGKLV